MFSKVVAGVNVAPAGVYGFPTVGDGIHLIAPGTGAMERIGNKVFVSKVVYTYHVEP